MIESPGMILASTIANNNGNLCVSSQLSKVVLKVNDIVKHHNNHNHCNLRHQNHLSHLYNQRNSYLNATLIDSKKLDGGKLYSHPILSTTTTKLPCNHQDITDENDGLITPNNGKEQFSSNKFDVISFDDEVEPEKISLKLIYLMENLIKEAKSKTLFCGEVLIPCNLTSQIAQDIIGMSESEPCGLRGCTLYINVQEKDVCRRIGQIKLGDRSTIPTFELYLNLKRDLSWFQFSWLKLISTKFLGNFGRNSLVLSDGYKLSKKQLYRSLNSP